MFGFISTILLYTPNSFSHFRDDFPSVMLSPELIIFPRSISLHLLLYPLSFSLVSYIFI